jgi:cystathionine beta-lyase/cystathionine gamma-synthase
MSKEQLALLGGEKAVRPEASDIFTWPIVTERHEQAVLDVLRNRQMSGNGITKEFEKKYASMLGRKHGLAYPNGTSAILGAMYGLGIGLGDEVIASPTGPRLCRLTTSAPRLFSPTSIPRQFA